MKKKIISICLLLMISALVCYPVLFLLTSSVMGDQELSQELGTALSEGKGYVSWRLLPMTPTLRHYVELLLDSPEFFHMFWNSVKITGGVLIGQLLVGIPAAWGFAKYRFPLKKVLFFLYLILMMMPFQVTMLPSYLTLNRMELIDTQWSVILPAVFSTFPVFILYRFFCSVPEALLEAARIDGAGEKEVFLYIALPMGSSGIIAVFVLGFLEYWNLIEQPLVFLKSKNLWPLSLYLPNIDAGSAGIAFAASMVTLLPAFLVFLWGRDYLEQGIVASAVKE
ncbi:MAG: carbohydrate ABC transporter permease [Faecalicatena sp.]|uniref:carbohydrate ABC transporter permease n=1 Tax=Faecalicatena sp. TaxID=2005360 RepID=UPI0025834528|nr:carbohydrate ABC transporter permease [Faecalicatena sp.]MCI6467964.1 carbohydrate ABC transporter permease [Faecalicatena sp.]MDY5619394.1 carbohydrate ABC transporter permease [Lachnospiraceae bacterium]